MKEGGHVNQNARCSRASDHSCRLAEILQQVPEVDQVMDLHAEHLLVEPVIEELPEVVCAIGERGDPQVWSFLEELGDVTGERRDEIDGVAVGHHAVPDRMQPLATG